MRSSAAPRSEAPSTAERRGSSKAARSTGLVMRAIVAAPRRARGAVATRKVERMSDVVLYERRGPSAWITLNRPDKLNALNVPIVRGAGGRRWRAPRPTTRCASSC